MLLQMDQLKLPDGPSEEPPVPRKRGSLNRLLPSEDRASAGELGTPSTRKMQILKTPFARDSLVHQKSFDRSTKVQSQQEATHDLERFLFTLPLKVDVAALRASIADGAKYEVEEGLLGRAKEKLTQAEEAHALVRRKAIGAELELRYLQVPPADIRVPGMRSAIVEAEAAGVSAEVLEKTRVKLAEVLRVRGGVLATVIEQEHLSRTLLKTDAFALRAVLEEVEDLNMEGIDPQLVKRAQARVEECEAAQEAQLSALRMAEHAARDAAEAMLLREVLPKTVLSIDAHIVQRALRSAADAGVPEQVRAEKHGRAQMSTGARR